MANIEVKRLHGDTYRVEVREKGSQSVHQVSVTAADHERYGSGVTPERLLAASFEFLLEREPKESILSRFDLPVIERYFPEFPHAIRKRLG